MTARSDLELHLDQLILKILSRAPWTSEWPSQDNTTLERRHLCDGNPRPQYSSGLKPYGSWVKWPLWRKRTFLKISGKAVWLLRKSLIKLEMSVGTSQNTSFAVLSHVIRRNEIMPFINKANHKRNLFLRSERVWDKCKTADLERKMWQRI
jgi:hypothetical protein